MIIIGGLNFTKTTIQCPLEKGFESKSSDLLKNKGQLKDLAILFPLNWIIAAHASPYPCKTERYDLFLTETYIIVWLAQKCLLNKPIEFIL